MLRLPGVLACSVVVGACGSGSPSRGRDAGRDAAASDSRGVDAPDAPPACGLSACAMSPCTMTLAPSSMPVGIAVDSTSVYWTDDSSGTVNKVPIQGGTPTTLASGEMEPAFLALDSTSLYWIAGDSNGGFVKKVPLAGGTVTTLATTRGVAGIALDAQNVYWTDAVDGSVMSVPITGGTPTTLTTGENNPTFSIGQIAVHGTKLYWTRVESVTAPEIMTMPTTGGTPSVFATGPTCPNANLCVPQFIAVDNSNVYWNEVDQQALGSGYIARASLQTGAVTVLATGLTVPRGLAVDASNVYWVDQGDGAVYSVPIAGGPVTTVDSSHGGTYSVATDCLNLYWTGSGIVERRLK